MVIILEEFSLRDAQKAKANARTAKHQVITQNAFQWSSGAYDSQSVVQIKWENIQHSLPYNGTKKNQIPFSLEPSIYFFFYKNTLFSY